MADNTQADCEPRPAGRPLPGKLVTVTSGSHWAGWVNGRRRRQRALFASGTASCGGGFGLWRTHLALVLALAVSTGADPSRGGAAAFGGFVSGG